MRLKRGYKVVKSRHLENAPFLYYQERGKCAQVYMQSLPIGLLFDPSDPEKGFWTKRMPHIKAKDWIGRHKAAMRALSAKGGILKFAELDFNAIYIRIRDGKKVSASEALH